MIRNIESTFGKMTVTRGSVHEFLGMKSVNNENGTSTISTKGYLEEAISESGLNVAQSAATPAKRSLFEVNESCTCLDKERAEIFHQVSAKLLYMATRGRMDLLLSVCFLCTTRISAPTEEEDGLKLKRVLEYIKGPLDVTYTVLGADDFTIMT